MEVRKGKIEIELSNEEIDTLMRASKVLHELSYLLSQEDCHFCYVEEYGDEFSQTYIDEIHDSLNRITEITEIY